ncbi:MAG: hypothetical protein LUC44_03170 [Prevotellaceae bacterium]|nr:hypothetical protein [Prevotellaceae bacterium]
MNAKESLCALLESLKEINKKMPRQLLIDFVVGNPTGAIQKHNLDSRELFGCGDKHDEEHFSLVLDQAIKDKLIKQTDEMLSITPLGRKKLKENGAKPYIVNEEDEQGEPDSAAIDKAERSRPAEEQDAALAAGQQQEHLGHHTQLKIHLIQAMDRQISLDYFAEQNNVAFDEVLDELEEMKQSGRTFDISYFLDEVMDKTSQQELYDCFDEYGGNLERTIAEMGDVYNTEEIRLARLNWHK